MKMGLGRAAPEPSSAWRSTLALGVLGGITLFAALLSAAVNARPQEACCFRITLEVTGEARNQYVRVDPTDDQGLYAYLWDGTAYGLAHLHGSILVTDEAIGTGNLVEANDVKDSEGRPRDREDPGCPHGGGPGEATVVGRP